MNEKNAKNILTIITFIIIIIIGALIIYFKTRPIPTNQTLLPPPTPTELKISRPEVKYTDEGKIIELNILKEPYNLKIQNAQGKIYQVIIDKYTYLKTSKNDGIGIKGLADLEIGELVSFNSRQGPLTPSRPFIASSLISQNAPLISQSQEIFTLTGKR